MDFILDKILIPFLIITAVALIIFFIKEYLKTKNITIKSLFKKTRIVFIVSALLVVVSIPIRYFSSDYAYYKVMMEWEEGTSKFVDSNLYNANNGTYPINKNNRIFYGSVVKLPIGEKSFVVTEVFEGAEEPHLNDYVTFGKDDTSKDFVIYGYSGYYNNDPDNDFRYNGIAGTIKIEYIKRAW